MRTCPTRADFAMPGSCVWSKRESDVAQLRPSRLRSTFARWSAPTPCAWPAPTSSGGSATADSRAADVFAECPWEAASMSRRRCPDEPAALGIAPLSQASLRAPDLGDEDRRRAHRAPARRARAPAPGRHRALRRRARGAGCPPPWRSPPSGPPGRGSRRPACRRGPRASRPQAGPARGELDDVPVGVAQVDRAERRRARTLGARAPRGRAGVDPPATLLGRLDDEREVVGGPGARARPSASSGYSRNETSVPGVARRVAEPEVPCPGVVVVGRPSRPASRPRTSR